MHPRVSRIKVISITLRVSLKQISFRCAIPLEMEIQGGPKITSYWNKFAKFAVAVSTFESNNFQNIMERIT